MITATHGGSHKYSILADRVLAFDMVMADGSLKTIKKGVTPNFSNYLMNFGAIGVITSMTMLLVPTFNVQKSIFADL